MNWRRTLLIIAAATAALLAVGGVASANAPDLFVGQDARTHGNQCVGVVLDFDGHYNQPASGGGYDALVCTGHFASGLGWTHVAGYYMGAGTCENEYEFSTGRFVRQVCAPSGSGTIRTMSTGVLYEIQRTR